MDNHDYIRRILAKAKFTGNFQEEYQTAQIHALIDTVPAEDVQPVVHGKWIETEQPMGWDNVSCATCSVCGEDFVLDEWGIDDVRREMHYCMNCGARMDLEDDDD